jgi:septal ring factor EnvC (AmiA/AmiB activator)
MMNIRYFIITALFILSFKAKAAEPVLQKTSITAELLELRGELTQASARIIQLRKDKQAIEQSFKDLEDWALNQQTEKIHIYEENTEIRSLLSSAEQRVVNEKTAHQKTADKYDRIKAIMGYLAGAFLALLYIKFGSSVTSMLAVAGPWGPIVHLLGPFGAFTAGYMFIKFYF